MAGEPPAKRGKYETWMLDPNVPIPRTTKWRIFNTTKSSDRHREKSDVWPSNQEDESSCEAANESNESDKMEPLDQPPAMANEIHIQVDPDMCSDYEETSDEEDDTFIFSSESEPDESKSPDETCENEICLENVGNISDEDNTLLYQNAGISNMAALLIFHLFVTETKLSNHAMEDLIRLINALLPSGHKFVRSGYLLKKYFVTLFQEPLPKKHKYCSICMGSISALSNSCGNENCQTANATVKEFLEIDLRNQLSRLYQDPEFVKNLRYRFSHDYLNEENILDIFSGSSYKELLKPGGFLGSDSPLNLSFSFYTDGINPFKSSNKQNLWPIFLMINELPPELRQCKKYLLLAGLWCSQKKPNMLTFGRPVMDAICDLHNNGMTVTTTSGEATVHATLPLSTEDLQAKALVTNMKQFNGENGCSTCLDTGKITGKNSLHRTWPYNPHLKYRTHKSVIKCASQATKLGKPVKGVKGASIFMLFKNFNLVDGFVPDWMHGVCLGVVKNLIALWLNSENRSKAFYVGDKIATIDKRLTSIKVPDLLPRKPRSLSDRAHWKATEFRAWLLYYSVPVLNGILHHTYLQHYSLLVSAMALLVGEKITPNELKEADNLIDLFCKELASHYGDKAMTMNAHQLRHYVYFVRRFGPLWVYSCFGFETMNGCLTNMIHGTRHIAEQVAFSLSVVRNLPTVVKNLNPANNSKEVIQLAKKLVGEKNKNSPSLECYSGCLLLGKPKHQCLRKKHREALNTFLSCRGMPVISSTQLVDTYLRLKIKAQTITSMSYTRANKTCSYTVEFYDSNGKIQFGDVCCYVYLQATPVAIVNTYKVIPGSVIDYKGFGLTKHISKVLGTNNFMAIKLDQIKQICIKIEIPGNNDIYISRFANMVERN